jgi:hypothetical protein
MMKEEMKVLAQDETALIKMRKDGWNCGEFYCGAMVYIQHVLIFLCCIMYLETTTQPVHPEPYPGLYAGEYGPTEAALENANPPLRLFLLFYATDNVA